MDPVTGQASNTRATQNLTIAIWALVIVVLLNAAATAYSVFLPAALAHRINDLAPSFTSSMDYSPSDAFANFHDWSIEKQVQGASVIAFTKYKNEDGKLKSMIADLPKQNAGTVFNYKVGDEYTPDSRYPRENTQYGEGEVIFFTGSPAMMRFSATYSDGRINGMGDLPMKKLVELIEKEK
jgi:hypothetical protein